MTNKSLERWATLVLQMPTGINISSGEVLLLGRGTHVAAGVAATAQNTTNPVYDSDSGYVTVDFEGAFNLERRSADARLAFRRRRYQDWGRGLRGRWHL